VARLRVVRRERLAVGHGEHVAVRHRGRALEVGRIERVGGGYARGNRGDEKRAQNEEDDASREIHPVAQ
jgi:hypothetical protein